MNILKFLKKNVSNLGIFSPLLINQDKNTIIIVILLLLIYSHKSTNIITDIYKKISKNSNSFFSSNKSKKSKKSNELKNDNIEKLDELNELHEFEYIKKDNIKEQKSINIEIKKKDFNKLEENNNLSNENSDISTINTNIKLHHKKTNKALLDNLEYTPYSNDKKKLKKNYSDKTDNNDFSVNVNQAICSTPIFTLRTYKDIDFYFNFLLHNYDTKKIHNLIMCKDIHKWMNSSSLTDQDISNELVPIYFSLKKKEKVDVFEYLKIFIHSSDDGKIAFIQKGNDYLVIEKYIQDLIDKEIILDLLDEKLYTSYNLSGNEGVSDFLNKFLSLVLISENSIGEQVKLDIENYYENKSTYDYFFNTVNADSTMFNTTI
jgi:hypothetical protein